MKSKPWSKREENHKSEHELYAKQLLLGVA